MSGHATTSAYCGIYVCVFVQGGSYGEGDGGGVDGKIWNTVCSLTPSLGTAVPTEGTRDSVQNAGFPSQPHMSSRYELLSAPGEAVCPDTMTTYVPDHRT